MRIASALASPRTTKGVGRVEVRLVSVGKDAAQPFAGLAHRHPGFVDDADPEHEAVIDAVITTRCGGYAGGL
jgi:hypothetical protein